MRVVGAGDGFARPVRVWNVPPPHEDNRLSWPDRQAIRRASDDTELEHNSCDPANFEGSEEHAIAGDLAPPCRASMSAMAMLRQLSSRRQRRRYNLHMRMNTHMRRLLPVGLTDALQVQPTLVGIAERKLVRIDDCI